MNRRKMLTILAALVLSTGAPHVQAQEDALESNELRIGYRTDAAPFSYRDEAGQPAGYSIELCRRIVETVQNEKGRLTVEYIPLGAAERGTALMQDRVDLLCGADSVTLERRTAVSFSIPIFMGGIGALLRTDAPSRLQALLEGEEPEFRPRWRASFGQILRQRTFAVIEGSLAEKWLAGRIDEFKIISETSTVADYASGVSQVEDRKADVLFADRAILLDVVLQGTDSDRLYVVGRRFTDEPMALAMRIGDDDLRLSVDKTLSRLYRSGEIDALYGRYFGEMDDDTRTLFRLSALPE